MKLLSCRFIFAGATILVAAVGVAQSDLVPPQPGVQAGSIEGAPELTSPAPAGIPYYEYFNYSAYAKRSYVPGYTPHPTSLFENPKDYPWSLCVMANPYYQYAGIPGWHFNSPQGYQSSIPPGSHAAKYYRGELGITSNLRGGYPQGLRVVEDAIVPVAASSEKGGIFIQGGSLGAVQVATESDVSFSPAPPLPMPVPTPAAIEK